MIWEQTRSHSMQNRAPR